MQFIVRRARLIGNFENAGGLFVPPTGTGGTNIWFNGDFADGVISNGGLTWTTSSAGDTPIVAKNFKTATGKFYAEFKFVSAFGGIGVANASFTPSASNYLGIDSNSVGWYPSSGNIVFANSVPNNFAFPGRTLASVFQMAVDFGNNDIWFNVDNGNWNANPSANPATNTSGLSFGSLGGPSGALAAGSDIAGAGAAVIANFGQSAYAFTPPAGFGNW
jgi:hypothetical protein